MENARPQVFMAMAVGHLDTDSIAKWTGLSWDVVDECLNEAEELDMVERADERSLPQPKTTLRVFA